MAKHVLIWTLESHAYYSSSQLLAFPLLSSGWPVMLLSFCLHHRGRLQAGIDKVAARTRAGWLCTRTLYSMPRENAARAWTPGDAVVFSPDGRASTSGECTSSTSTSSTKTRQPLAAMKHAKQSRKLSEEDVNRPKQHQSTLSPWAKAAWKPGMRVLIATSSKQSTESMIEKDSIKVSQSGKGKERALDSELFAKDKYDCLL